MQQYHDNFDGFIRFLEQQGVEPDFNVLDRHLIRDYVLYMRTKDYAPSTINTRLKTLRVMFRTLLDEELIDSNPMNGVKLVPDPFDRVDVLTVADFTEAIKCTR